MAAIRILIESTPIWSGAVEDPAKVELPAVVVDRIRDQAVWAREHGARIPKVEIEVTR
jgi:hypothetical protein